MVRDCQDMHTEADVCATTGSGSRPCPCCCCCGDPAGGTGELPSLMGGKCCTDRKPRPQGWREKPLPNKMGASLRQAWAEGVSGQALFVVYLDNEDKSIGLEVEADSLEIKAVTPGGLLDKYCEQENEFVCPGDKIYSVNDFTDKTDVIRQLKEESQLEIMFSKLIVDAKIIKKPGKKLGAATDTETFTILKIADESLIADWNKQNPKERICIGDRVIAVNGIVDNEKAKQEIGSKEELLLRVMRGPRRAEQDPMGATGKLPPPKDPDGKGGKPPPPEKPTMKL
ncbi:hypothetical protein AK812_SmicGene27878 [Symbiodinium microadriaticum]|uniref:Uncharacterized protein n=1 Tax=Symbiodinium microadriaticum TaxID=2951 RepID=A0A1Q9D5W7_SYMMI|nr:hypothetical protein AK812_SmicGene27878 [Symbiodinium microadriaticum]CAE7868564.1 unnamed protein product [Symbiodinium microadriaticum]CAE7939460.1 unnamed protein product [Symbiodinium sp. KB8]